VDDRRHELRLRSRRAFAADTLNPLHLDLFRLGIVEIFSVPNYGRVDGIQQVIIFARLRDLLTIGSFVSKLRAIEGLGAIVLLNRYAARQTGDIDLSNHGPKF